LRRTRPRCRLENTHRYWHARPSTIIAPFVTITAPPVQGALDNQLAGWTQRTPNQARGSGLPRHRPSERCLCLCPVCLSRIGHAVVHQDHRRDKCGKAPRVVCAQRITARSVTRPDCHMIKRILIQRLEWVECCCRSGWRHRARKSLLAPSARSRKLAWSGSWATVR